MSRLDDTVGSEDLPDHPTCPHCGGEETEQYAAFGSSLSVSQYYCRRCRTVFEFFKWRRNDGRDRQRAGEGRPADPGDGGGGD